MMPLHAGGIRHGARRIRRTTRSASGETIVQVHAMGPFALTYVNPADMPKAAPSRR